MSAKADPRGILQRLLSRLAHGSRDRLVIGWADLQDWPEALLPALLEAKVLRKVPAATSLVCPGCDYSCPMEVFRDTDTDTGNTRSFIVCDRRNDVGYVNLHPELLTQWQLARRQIANFLARELVLTPTSVVPTNHTIPLGWIAGKYGSKTVTLNFGGEPHLVIGKHAIPLTDALIWNGRAIGVETDRVQVVADQRDEFEDSRYTPSIARREARKLETRDRHLGWQRQYRRLRRAHPDWSDDAIATTICENDPGPRKPKASTVRRYMKP